MKNKSLLNKLYIALCLTFLVTSCFAQKKESMLDGRTYIVEVTELNMDGTSHVLEKDEIRFKEGMVSAKFGTKNGFPGALYKVMVNNAVSPAEITFKGESKNADRNTLKWVGSIKGEIITGRAPRTRTNKKGCDYVFSGKLIKK